jgi:hypothetical protein
MVHLGVAQVFEGHVAHPFERAIDVYRSGAYFFQQGFQVLAIHS